MNRARPDKTSPTDAMSVLQVGPGPGPGPRLAAFSSLITGGRIVNLKDETLGNVSDFMIDLQRGCIAYAVMASGGFMGMGERLFALPWKALTLDAERCCFVIDVARSTLDTAPDFDKDHWPDHPDAQWHKSVHRHYAVRPYWE